MEPAKKVPKKGKGKHHWRKTTFFFRFQPFISSLGLYHGWVSLLQKPTCWVTFYRKFLLVKVTHLPVVGSSTQPNKKRHVKLDHETPNLRGEKNDNLSKSPSSSSIFLIFWPMLFFRFFPPISSGDSPPHPTLTLRVTMRPKPQGTSPVWMPARCVPGRWEDEWNATRNQRLERWPETNVWGEVTWPQFPNLTSSAILGEDFPSPKPPWKESPWYVFFGEN